MPKPRLPIILSIDTTTSALDLALAATVREWQLRAPLQMCKQTTYFNLTVSLALEFEQLRVQIIEVLIIEVGLYHEDLLCKQSGNICE